MNLATDKDGYLKHLGDWNPEVAAWLAQSVGVVLTDEHWEVINALRAFYEDTGVSPAMRILVKIVKQKVSIEEGNPGRISYSLGTNPTQSWPHNPA